MDSIIDKEITEELMKEMGITSIEEYHMMVKDDKKEIKQSKSKKKEEKAQISKTKQKEMLRKKELAMNRKLKNEHRSEILKSLEQYKLKNEFLGHKKEKEQNLITKKNKKPANNINQKEEEKINEEDFEDNDSESSEESIKQYTETKEIKLESALLNKVDILDDEKRKEIIKEIKDYRNQFIDEDDIIDIINNNIMIPDKNTIKFVKRKENIEEERKNLPVIKFEHEIMDKINNNLFTIICGETGSGKSTQIPQFIYEFGYTNYGKIAVTQPRKVAAISLARRLADELNMKFGEDVGYQVRYDSTHFTEKTDIKVILIYSSL
jgi:hypothetical protein